MSTEDAIDDATSNIAAPFKDVAPIGNTPVAPAHGIAAIALSMALKYHDMGMIKDGALYQQYKLEGRNITNLHLSEVFETAIKMEAHLLGSSDRIAKMIIDAISVEVEDDQKAPHEDASVQTQEEQSRRRRPGA